MQRVLHRVLHEKEVLAGMCITRAILCLACKHRLARESFDAPPQMSLYSTASTTLLSTNCTTIIMPVTDLRPRQDK